MLAVNSRRDTLRASKVYKPKDRDPNAADQANVRATRLNGLTPAKTDLSTKSIGSCPLSNGQFRPEIANLSAENESTLSAPLRKDSS